MKITDIFKKQQKTFSFEFFPPKDEISAVDFGINVGKLLRLSPSFVSVTYGAGGSTQERTFALVNFLQNTIGLNTMAHYTCVNATRDKIDKDIKHLNKMGINNLMLLRGDPPKGKDKFEAIQNGFNYASELISFVKKKNDVCVGGAAYPEIHVESATMEDNLNNLKIKIDAGADFLITQMFFENDHYFDFVGKVRAKGINCRIIPGIIPITNFNQINRFAEMTGTYIPENLVESMRPHRDNPEKIYQIGVEYAINQCRDLLMRGAPGLHFYTLNKSRASVEIFESLLLR